MRVLAVDTDGMAVLDRNDVSGGLDRIARDLASYYLLAYYSTNAKLDGKFREITVRVTRPGVQTRSRRGYRSPTADELASASTSRGAPPDPRSGVAAALADLDLQLLRNSAPVGPVRLFRRGPLTGNQLVPAASLTFSRTDRLHLERHIEASATAEGTARILDRNGQTLPIALTTTLRTDDDARRWVTTDVSLAPLGAGDYVIEIDAAGERTLTAIRIGR
jgi:hypothetical protein